jgi:hypothetical protein
MEDIKYEGLMGILSEIKKGISVIQMNNKVNENQQVNQPISKEEIEKIVHEKVSVMATFIELKIKQQMENQTNAINQKMSAVPVYGNHSFPPPKKITFFGFEFLRTSVVIFILSVAISWSLVMNIKQIDDYRVLKTRSNQLTEYVIQLQKSEKIEKVKGNKEK